MYCIVVAFNCLVPKLLFWASGIWVSERHCILYMCILFVLNKKQLQQMCAHFRGNQQLFLLWWPLGTKWGHERDRTKKNPILSSCKTQTVTLDDIFPFPKSVSQQHVDVACLKGFQWVKAIEQPGYGVTQIFPSDFFPLTDRALGP